MTSRRQDRLLGNCNLIHFGCQHSEIDLFWIHKEGQTNGFIQIMGLKADWQDIGRQAGSNCIIELIQLCVTFDQLASVKSLKPVNKNQFQSGKTSKALIAADLLCKSNDDENDTDGDNSKVVFRPLLYYYYIIL